MRLRVHKHSQGHTEDRAGDGKSGVDGHGVVVQGAVGEGVQGGLDELAGARDADDGAVDAPKGGEAEDFGGVVTVGKKRRVLNPPLALVAKDESDFWIKKRDGGGRKEISGIM